MLSVGVKIDTILNEICAADSHSIQVKMANTISSTTKLEGVFFHDFFYSVQCVCVFFLHSAEVDAVFLTNGWLRLFAKYT